jgi:hypothetical protein
MNNKVNPRFILAQQRYSCTEIQCYDVVWKFGERFHSISHGIVIYFP